MNTIVYITADGLISIETTNEAVGRRKYRTVSKRMTSFMHGERCPNRIESNAREYEYVGRVKDVYVYEEVVTK